MKRHEDWPERLGMFLAERKDMPFEWGSQDCCLFVCDAVLAMTGTDLAADFRGTYTDALCAARAIKAYAGAGVEALAEKMAGANGIQEIPPEFAQRGDVVLFDTTEYGETLGIVGMMGYEIVSTGELGARYTPTAEGIRAWRIG
jgi:hypothetical protein